MKSLFILFVLLLNSQNLWAQIWSKPKIIIDELQGYPDCLSLAVGNDSKIHLIWAYTQEMVNIVYTHNQDGIWVSPRSVFPDQANISNTTSPYIAVGMNNVPHITWSGNALFPDDNRYNYTLYYSKLVDGSWAIPQEMFCSEERRTGIAGHKICIDNENVYLYWQTLNTGGTLWLITWDGSQWTEPVKPIPEWIFPNGGIFEPDLYPGEDTLHVVFTGAPPVRSWGGKLLDVYYSCSSKTGSLWISPVEVYRNSAVYCHDPKIVVDRDGVRHITWLEDTNGNVVDDAIFYSHSRDGKMWSEPILLSDLGDIAITLHLKLDSQNTLHVIWSHYHDKTFHSYYIYGRFDAWSSPQEIPQQLNGRLYSSIRAVDIDSQDRLHIVWKEEYGSDEKKFRLCYAFSEAPQHSVVAAKRENKNIFQKLDNYPNPFNQMTNFVINGEEAMVVTVKIYNPLGQLVKTLMEKRMVSEQSLIQWDGTNQAGRELVSGIYFCRAEVESVARKEYAALTKKIIIMR